MNMLFIIPRVKTLFGDQLARPSHPHVGIAYLIAYLKKKGIDSSVYDDGITDNFNILEDRIKRIRPDLIGITSYSYNYNELIRVMKFLSNFKDLRIVIGGPHISTVKKDFLKEVKADFLIKREAELSLSSLLEEISKDSPVFTRISGLIWRKNGEVVENDSMAYVEDLDSLPFPDYKSFGLERYNCWNIKRLPLITSRGCPYSCTYCAANTVVGKRFRVRSPQNVIKEIEYWKGEGFDKFDINDDCFNFNIKRAEEFCDLLIQKKLNITYDFYNGLRADKVTFELLKKMKASGCRFIAYGCESGNGLILRKIKKGLTLDIIRMAVDMTRKVGIRHCVNFIIGHPGETPKEAQDTLDFAKSLKCDFVNVYNLIPYPGTELYRWIEKNAVFTVDKETYLSRIAGFNTEPVFETIDFTRKERERFVREGIKLYKKNAIKI